MVAISLRTLVSSVSSLIEDRFDVEDEIERFRSAQ
jgi:hypothetical protein